MFVDYFRAINKKAVREEQFCSSELWTEHTSQQLRPSQVFSLSDFVGTGYLSFKKGYGTLYLCCLLLVRTWNKVSVQPLDSDPICKRLKQIRILCVNSVTDKPIIPSPFIRFH
jgi:hypothetical protein